MKNKTKEKGLLVKKSRNGKGIFTQRDFSNNQEIFEVKGTLVTCNEDDDMDEKTRANTYRYSTKHYISPAGEIGDFLNHSCDPNAKVVKRNKKLFIVAIQDILKDIEVTIDYSTIIASDDSWEMDCNCGSRMCRGSVGKFRSLPKSLKNRYILNKIVPQHILK